LWCLLLTLLPVTALVAQTEGMVEDDKAPIHFKTFGQGKPVLIINGGPGLNCNGFDSLAQQLSVHSKIIIYDQRGTGKSRLARVDSTTVTIDLMAEDIERLRKFLQIEQWVVLGHSFGGMLACYYISKYPLRVTSLILSSSGGVDLELLDYITGRIQSHLTEAEQKEYAFQTTKISEGDTSFQTKLNWATALSSAYLYHKQYIPLMAKRLTELNTEIAGLVWADMQQIQFDCSASLAKLPARTLIIQGRQDVISEKTAIKANRLLKNSTLVILDRCGHYGWLDREDAYLETLRTFIHHTKPAPPR
jgi:proline iminopeptidase